MAKTTKSFLALLRGGNLGVPLVILCILAMVILPLPPALLDILFTFNIVLAVMVLLVAVSAKRPLEFSLFPTILLITTLMRLTLNVASTRVVLLHGHLGADAAGKVIESFGQVVIGGNFVVGFVVFIILMIINFIVVTKGAERISEVSARFTLDAMPGKQMAIDADLNAGLINQAQAQTRRKDVASEADFYGAMDGASKFVRGGCYRRDDDSGDQPDRRRLYRDLQIQPERRRRLPAVCADDHRRRAGGANPFPATLHRGGDYRHPRQRQRRYRP